MVRTTTASGRASRYPSMCSPVRFCVANPHDANRTGTTLTPRRVSAAVSSRACQSIRSTTRPTLGRGRGRSIAKRSAEGRIEQAQIDLASVKAFAGFQRCHGNFCRTEQHRIDGVEVALDPLEDFREWAAIVGRGLAGKLFGKRARLARGAGHEELDLSAEDDRIVGS